MDILLVGNINRSKVSSDIGKIEKDLGREIRYVVLEEEDYKYRLGMGDKFLVDILEGDKIIVVDKVR